MSDISFGPKFPASAASGGGNIDLTGDCPLKRAQNDIVALVTRIAALEAENARLRAALEFYANADRWGISGDIQYDSGGRARAALAASAGEG